MRLTREKPWTQQHPDIMGPSNSYLYFGPNRAPGYLVYGNSPPQSMANARRQKKETSSYAQRSALIGTKRLTELTLPQIARGITSRRTVKSSSGRSLLSDSRYAVLHKLRGFRRA